MLNLIKFMLFLTSILVIAILLFNQYFELLDAFNQFQEFYFIFLLIGVSTIIFFDKARKTNVKLLLFFIFLGLIITCRYILQEHIKANHYHDNQAYEYSLLSMNVHHNDLDGASFLSYIENYEPDFLLLQEFSGSKIAEIAQEVRKFYPYEQRCVIQSYCHTIIFSKHAFIETDNLVAAQKSILNGNLHRTALAKVALPTGSSSSSIKNLALYAVHLRWPIHFNDEYSTQRQQVRTLIHSIQNLNESQAIIMAGDFNSVPWSYNLSLLKNGTNLRLVDTPTKTWGPTLYENAPNIPIFDIDHFFASENIIVHKTKKLGFAGSDHWPQIMYFSLN